MQKLVSERAGKANNSWGTIDSVIVWSGVLHFFCPSVASNSHKQHSSTESVNVAWKRRNELETWLGIVKILITVKAFCLLKFFFCQFLL